MATTAKDLVKSNQFRFVKLGDELTKKESVWGMRLSNGEIIVTSAYLPGALQHLLLKQFNAERVTVSGTWVFVPDTVEENHA